MSLSSVLSIFSIIEKVAPLVLGFMQIAETSKASGEIKKQTVTDMAKVTIESMSGITTGGARETWKQIETPITKPGGLIDLLAALFFGSRTSIPLDDIENP
ncbi:MAG: hypothetical protein JRC60_05680 [Deltaproteobacteria bacterium]|nr:hypothetical protein [Deltaproteobacteria bacterium]